MGRIMRGREITRGFGVSRLLLGAALGAFGSLFLGALGMATIAWASDESAEASGLAAVTDPLAAEVSDMSRLAARLVPHDQQGHRPPSEEQQSPGLVSGLTAPVDSLMDQPVEAVRDMLHDDARTGPSDGESTGDDAAGAVTPTLGTLVQGASSVMERPVGAVSGVYETVAPWVRPVTDGLLAGDAALPGSAPAGGGGQPSLTTLQPAVDSTEEAVAPNAVPDDRSAARLGQPAVPPGAQDTDRAGGEPRRPAPHEDAAQRWGPYGPALPDLNVIPGGAPGSTAGISVDGGHAAVEVSSNAGGEQVSFARPADGEPGRPMDRAAELSVAPD